MRQSIILGENMNTLIEEKVHARLSPSASKRWMTCPGSVKFIERLNIKDVPSKYAAEGTVAHEVHEKCLLSGEDADSHIGRQMTVDGFKFTVTAAMAEAVQTSLDYIRERIADHEDFGYTVELRVEVRASLKYLSIPGLDGGTSDVVLLVWDGDELVEIEIIDYKHGAGVAVEAEHNTQALCYALGSVVPYSDKHDTECNIRITISQPRAMHKDGPIRSWEISAFDLDVWCISDLVPKAQATLENDAPLVPSDEGCRFCPAAGQCPELYKKTQEIAMADFAEDKFPDPQAMTADQKKVVMEHAEMIRSFIVAVENQVKLEMDHGSTEYEDEYKLVYKTVHRKLTEEAQDEDFSPLLDYLEPEEIYEQKLKPLSDIEKALKKHMKPKEAKEVMEKLTWKPEPGIVVAPVSDKRKAVAPTMISDFTNLDD